MLPTKGELPDNALTDCNGAEIHHLDMADTKTTKAPGKSIAAGTKKPNPIDVHVGARVRLRRNMLNMSQEKLGESMGLTFQQVQKYEKGTNRIGASRLWKLSQVLSVPVSFFFDEMVGLTQTSSVDRGQRGFAEPEAENQITEFLTSRDGIDLNRAFLQIKDAKQRRSVIELVRVMASDSRDDDAK